MVTEDYLLNDLERSQVNATRRRRWNRSRRYYQLLLLSVGLIAYLRGEARFDGLEALTTQMAADCDQAREILSKAGL